MDFLLVPLNIPSPPPPPPFPKIPINATIYDNFGNQPTASHRTDAFEIVLGQWPQRNFYAFLSTFFLPWELLPAVTTTAIVPSVCPVVQIKSVDRGVTVCTTTSVELTGNAVITNASVVRPLVPVLTTTSVTLASSAVMANASVVRLLVPVRTTTNVDRARNAVIANASVVRLLVPVHTTTNVTVASSAVIANASVNRLLVTVRTTPIVTLERIVVGEFVRHHTVVGVVELLQALLSAQLFSSPSSFPLCPVSAVLVAHTTAIVHPVLRSSPANSHSNKWSQLTHT